MTFLGQQNSAREEHPVVKSSKVGILNRSRQGPTSSGRREHVTQLNPCTCPKRKAQAEHRTSWPNIIAESCSRSRDVADIIAIRLKRTCLEKVFFFSSLFFRNGNVVKFSLKNICPQSDIWKNTVWTCFWKGIDCSELQVWALSRSLIFVFLLSSCVLKTEFLFRKRENRFYKRSCVVKQNVT